MHLLLAAVLEVDATDTTLADLLSHLKPHCTITTLNHTTLPGKITYWIVASCVALTTLLTSPHEMAAHKKGARKDGTTGGVLATESRESRHEVYSKMATSWGSTARGGHIFRTMDGRVVDDIIIVES